MTIENLGPTNRGKSQGGNRVQTSKSLFPEEFAQNQQHLNLPTTKA